MNYKRLLSFAFLLCLFFACDPDDPEPTLTATDFIISIDENPSEGQVLGTIETDTNQENLTFSLSNQLPDGAMTIDSNTGTLTVADTQWFDFERSSQISAEVTVTTGDLSVSANISITIRDVEEIFRIFDFDLSIDENPSEGQVLGVIQKDTEQGNLQFQLISESPAGALALDINSGTLTVADASLFNFEANPQITATFEMNAGPLKVVGEIVIRLNNVAEEFTVSDFTLSIDENPQPEQILGTIQTEAQGNRNFSLSNESPMGALAINANNGTLSVADSSFFDFETFPQITATVTVTSEGFSTPAEITVNLNDVTETFTIWMGAKMTFTKADDTDPTQEANQDRISDHVWITRGYDGQIFNAVIENSANKNISPLGTEWALGSSTNIRNLTFGRFRSSLGSPRNLVGKNLVLHLIEDDVYLDVKFLSWTSSGGGGFSYERSTQE